MIISAIIKIYLANIIENLPNCLRSFTQIIPTVCASRSNAVIITINIIKGSNPKSFQATNFTIKAHTTASKSISGTSARRQRASFFEVFSGTRKKYGRPSSSTVLPPPKTIALSTIIVQMPTITTITSRSSGMTLSAIRSTMRAKTL